MELSVREAGRKGGAATLEKMGVEHYRRIGKIAGDKRKAAGWDYAAMAAKGGASTKARYGPEYMKEIARRGGEANAARRGPEGMAEIGKKGGAKGGRGRPRV